MTQGGKGWWLVLAIGACGELEREGGLVDVSADVCASGKQWTGGNEGSGLMHPGHDCIGCHARSREAPAFSVAGTVYGSYAEPDDCAGVVGVTVEVVDAQNRGYRLTTNAAGNFFLRTRDGAVAPPFRVTVLSGGNKRDMVDSPSSGSCNVCHTSTGAQDAPGRVRAPSSP